MNKDTKMHKFGYALGYIFGTIIFLCLTAIAVVGTIFVIRWILNGVF